MVLPLIAAAISGASQIYGAKLAQQNQEKMARQSIQMKVADAKMAGIHPLFAMGAPTYSPSVSVGQGIAGAGRDVGAAISQLGKGVEGQSIDRALMATRSGDERTEAFNRTVQEMQLQRLTLQNDILASQIAKLRDNATPPLPMDNAELKMETKPKSTGVLIHGSQIRQDRGMSDTKEVEDRYGESIADWLYGPYVTWRDFNNHYVQPRITEMGRELREFRGKSTFDDRFMGRR